MVAAQFILTINTELFNQHGSINRRSSRWSCSIYKKVFLKLSQNSQENTCTGASFLTKLKKKTLAQVFSWKFCEICKNTFFTKHLQVTASVTVFKIMHSQVPRMKKN